MRRTTPITALAALLIGVCLAPTPYAQDAPTFSADVWPIMVERCIKCHGPKKQKEGLRFDDLEWAGDTELIVPGSPEKSLLHQQFLLPERDEKRMPNEGDPLTKDQIDTIGRWIIDGASYGDWDLEAAVAALPQGPTKSPQDLLLERLAADTTAADDGAMQALREAGALALPLAMENPLVRVDFQLSDATIDGNVLKKLDAVADQITWLGLARTAIENDDLAYVSKLKKLTTLHLENTTVSDEGLKHLEGLENLYYLNLYGTQVSDEGLKHLEGLGNLHRLYLWQSNATQEGADKLALAIPGLEVNLGIDLAITEDEAEDDKADFSALFDDGSCCADAHAKDEACDHDCCIAAAAKDEVCTECNPGAKAKFLEDFSKAETEIQLLSFNKDIRPILSQNCFQCHGPDANVRQAFLRLDVREVAVENAIVPGDIVDSPLVQRIGADDADFHMPPPDSGRSLTQDQIALLTQWVAEGAEYEPHWALIAPKRPSSPSVAEASRAANPIDLFILAELEKNELGLSPPADAATLVRRLSFDLTGLPPETRQVEAFAADPSEEAYETLVDAMLASPHYGERMATDWLDLVRYADTNGYHSDEPRSVWPYRDYVINAFNANMPFDQFTIEQLSGDLLPERTIEQIIASGYNRLNQITAEGGAQPKEYRAIYASDRVRTTSSVWLGATMGCAQCHDHKFDPYTSKDFYSFSAFFADLDEKAVYGSGQKWEPILQLPSDDQKAEKDEVQATLALLREEIDTPTEEILLSQWKWENETLEFLSEFDTSAGWAPAKPEEFTSSGGATLEVLDDFSILATGTKADTEVYTTTIKTNLRNITAILLEALGDPSIGKGLSRQGNLTVVTGFSVEATRGGKTEDVEIADARTDRFLPKYEIENIVDDEEGGAWLFFSDTSGDRVKAIFTLDEPVRGGRGTELKIRISQGSAVAPQMSIGRFRLSLTTADAPMLDAPEQLPEPVYQALRVYRKLRTGEESKTLTQYYRGISPLLETARRDLSVAQKRLEKLDDEIPITLISKSIEPRETRILPRGNWLDDSGEIVLPATPAALPPLGVEGRRATRLDLARWIVSGENPLTARVFVNRLWRNFFGRGLSKVLDDLGSQGEWPTHPELLDWLAVEFVESGWDIKHVAKLIVTSSAYRQSSIPNDVTLEIDPYNRLLARQTSRRLAAEMVRDNALAISGLLARDIGGRSVYPYQPAGYYDNCNQFGAGPALYPVEQDRNQYRRGMYTFWKRSFMHPSMMAFDAPTREECVAQRPASNTPQQALVLLNDPTYLEAARAFAERIIREGGDRTEDRLEFAYREALSRTPKTQETALLRDLYQKHLMDYTKNPDEAKKALQTGIRPCPDDLDTVELASWTSVARVILNLHETITRA